MTRPARFPVGSVVRVRSTKRELFWRRRFLAGLVGVVVAADAFRVVVHFPDERRREAFGPHQLEPVAADE
jgi:hypothetical protein